jgi:hypothetical protein
MNKKVATILKIMHLYFSNDCPERLKEEVRDWLVNGTDEEEKETALGILFDEMVDNASPPDSDTYRALRELKIDLGMITIE